MASRWLGPGLSPGQLYLRSEQGAILEILNDLRDAASDAERRLLTLGTREGLGARVRRAQLSLIRRELRIVEQVLWNAVGQRIRAAGPGIAQAAVIPQEQLEQALYRMAGRTLPDPLAQAQRAYARRVVTTYFARGTSRRPLSTRIYRSQLVARGWVERIINRVVLQGGSWQELAAAVRPSLHPSVPGGVSYAAKRLARTELNNAFHEVNRQSAQVNPYVRAMQWHLSATHVSRGGMPEICELYARHRAYAPEQVPEKPHPQCLCFLVPVPISEAEFLRRVLADTDAEIAAEWQHARPA